MKPELVNSKTIYRGKVFDLRQDQVRLPNGKVMQLDIVEHPVAVVLVPVDAQGNIWLIRQYRHSAGGEILELPAGVTEANEPVEASARRELREEIGMQAGDIHLIGEFFIAPGYTTEYLFIYLATDLSSAPLPGDEDEFIEVVPTPIQEAFAMAKNGQIRDAKTLAALLLATPYLDVA
jgi:8-oxo-dGTP pyrophosphatase MutT (NUDIX family)